MLTFAAPGQGSQSQGFLNPWIEARPSLADRLNDLSVFCEKDLLELGTKTDEETIRQTENAQPLIVGAAIAIYREFCDGMAQATLGHSVGEFAAAAIAGVVSDEDAMRLVSARANAMAKAAKTQETSMAAVLGGEVDAVLASISEHGLYAANFNGPGQIVAAGEKKAIEALIANPPERARVIELKVAGAFHTPFMSDAVAELASVAETVQITDPRIPVWTNFDGSLQSSGKEFVEHLVQQTAREVRWDKCMEQLQIASAKVVELPPAGALSGLLKRGAADLSALALKSPDDMTKVSEL